MKPSNFKLGTKLGAAFFAMVMLTVAVGGMGAWELARVNGSTKDLATNWLPSVKVLGELRDTTSQFRRAEARHVFAVSPTDLAAQEERMTRLKATLAEQQARYDLLISSPEERQLSEDFKRDLAAYYAADAKLLPISRAGELRLAEAKAAYIGDSLKAFNDVDKSLQVLIDLNNRGASASYAAGESAYRESLLWLAGLVLGAIGFAVVLGIWITRLITRPVAQAVAAAERMAAGDLTVPLHAEGRDETSQLLGALGVMQQNLARIVGGVRRNSEGVATASVEIAQGNNDLSGRTEEQASALEQTAASMEELTATVRQNADNAKQANQLALSASTVAVSGGEVVGRVVTTMEGINTSSKRIADIISVIDGIAFQTNILALNAAVEAARAGEQGRGFAVVASEVRSLAGRSADAAREIKQLIGASVEQVTLGSALVDQAGSTMADVVSAIKRVTDIMGEISAASAEQSTGVAQIGEAVTQMDQATQQNAALVEESAAAAESLKVQAQQLVEAVSVFTLAAADSGTGSGPMPTVRQAAMSARRAAMRPVSMAPATGVSPLPKPIPKPMPKPMATPMSAPPVTERRSPSRAKNVVRPAFKGPAPTASKPVAAAASGTDDWEAF